MRRTVGVAEACDRARPELDLPGGSLQPVAHGVGTVAAKVGKWCSGFWKTENPRLPELVEAGRRRAERARFLYRYVIHVPQPHHLGPLLGELRSESQPLGELAENLQIVARL